MEIILKIDEKRRYTRCRYTLSIKGSDYLLYDSDNMLEIALWIVANKRTHHVVMTYSVTSDNKQAYS